ncbi:hypothetical protein HF072_19060 [Bacillus sp. RO3]|nr:hypothetical protein [Bacillus sp. RO3]
MSVDDQLFTNWHEKDGFGPINGKSDPTASRSYTNFGERARHFSSDSHFSCLPRHWEK